MPGGAIVGDPDVPEFDPKAYAVKAVIDVLFDFVSPTEEQQPQTDRGLKDEIDRRGGYENLGTRGRNRDIRNVQGGQAHAEGMFKHLAGDRPVSIGGGTKDNPTYVGTDPDGNKITYRAKSKGDPRKPGYTGEPTVGVQQGDRHIKIRFVK